MQPPTTSEDFNRAYSAPLTFWGDIRVPPEVRALAQIGAYPDILELGCGLGRFAEHLATMGARLTAVDFSSVAIERARQRVAASDHKPHFLVGDVTHLEEINGLFDASYDVGCFHCLNGAGQSAYVREVARLLRPGGTHLIWAIDSSPAGEFLTPDRIATVFGPGFRLTQAHRSRRRLVASHWYWLQRSAPRE